MKKYFLYILFVFLSMFFFSGCAYRVNLESINRAILPSGIHDVSIFLASKTYSTYDKKLGKITMYYFQNKDGFLKESSVTEYIPYDFFNQLYSPFSNVTLTLRILTNNKAKTLDEALENEVKRNHFVRLYKNKDEFLIGNNFAFEIQNAIREFNDKMQRQDNSHPMFLLPRFPR